MRLAAALLAATLAAACAPASPELTAPQAGGENQCFQARLARAYTRVGPDTLLVEAGIRGTYRMELLDACPDLEWANEVAFRGRSGGTFVCSPLDAEIVFPRLGRPEVCLFRGMTRISPAEAAAYSGHRRIFRPWRPERRWPPVIRRPPLRPPPEPPPPPPTP